MKKQVHKTYISVMVLIILITTIYLYYTGISYYKKPLEERFYHPHHNWFKPSGSYGHGLGIFGTLMIFFGVTIYILRKRYNFLSKYIRLKYLLEFHIFLCTLGPILILFHTAFKFGGIVSIAFWSMVAVVLSGVIGRFIYIQIPRTIEGRALSLNEVKNMKTDLTDILADKFSLEATTVEMIVSLTNNQSSVTVIKNVSNLKKTLRDKGMPRYERKAIVKMVKNERSLTRKINRLQKMQEYFKYWHVAHLPFALIMLIIVILHIVVALIFGNKWIF